MPNDSQLKCPECAAPIKMRSFRLFNDFRIRCQSCGHLQNFLPFHFSKPSSDKEMPTRSQLARMIIHAGQLRSSFSMLLWIGLILILPFIFPRIGPDMLPFVWLSGCGLITWGLTYLICHRMVTCPKCGASLWNCGTGNFKPRRLRLRDDSSACPGCHAEFLP
jgi:hypothetical protein